MAKKVLVRFVKNGKKGFACTEREKERRYCTRRSKDRSLNEIDAKFE